MSSQGAAPEASDLPQLYELLAAPHLSLEEFTRLRKYCLNDPTPAVVVRWLQRAIRETDDVSGWYRLTGEPIEKDIADHLDAFKSVPEQYGETMLRLIRRFLLGRYAFGCVRRVNRRILELLMNQKQPWWNKRFFALSRLWLWKDYVIPRIGFSLIIGYGALLGAGDTADWLSKMSNHPRMFRWVVGAEGALILFLVFRNVRSRIGVRDARSLLKRTFWLTTVCFGWAGSGMVIHWLLMDKEALLHCVAAGLFSTGITALLLALLSQFFFGKSGSDSMAEPL